MPTLTSIKINLIKNKNYFGGGTILAATSTEHFYIRKKCSYSCLEDGTIPFNLIIHIDNGLKILRELGMENIQRHTMSLALYTYENLNSLKHSNGKPVTEIYGNYNTLKINLL